MMTTVRQVALVTGASSGIGKAPALSLVEAGFDVVGTSRDTSRIAPLDGVTFLDLDVASEKSVTNVIGQVVDRFGRIDVLVNNAGVGLTGAAEENYEKQRRIADQVIATAVRDGDAPATVAKAIVAAATDPNPRLRYTAGSMAGRISTLRRIVPSRVFYNQIRRYNRMAV